MASLLESGNRNGNFVVSMSNANTSGSYSLKGHNLVIISNRVFKQ